jgi:hypothetical protein
MQLGRPFYKGEGRKRERLSVEPIPKPTAILVDDRPFYSVLS